MVALDDAPDDFMGLEPDSQPTDTVESALSSHIGDDTPPEIVSLYDRLLALRTHRAAIDREIGVIHSQLGTNNDERRRLWHCLRCDWTWFGSIYPPAHCARCHSASWATPPLSKRDRHPSDPPNPRWHKRRQRKRWSPGRPRKPRAEAMAGPSQLPPLHLPKFDAAGALIPPLPPPSSPLPPMPSLVDRLYSRPLEPPQPEHSVAGNLDKLFDGRYERADFADSEPDPWADEITIEDGIEAFEPGKQFTIEELPNEVSPAQIDREVHDDSNVPHTRMEERPADGRDQSSPDTASVAIPAAPDSISDPAAGDTPPD